MEEAIPYITGHWYWFLALFYVAEKVVKLTPTKYDDIVVDILWGAVRQLAGKPPKK